ncbi:hypothetical protein, partial [Klebsiella pneumoniae]|uniref:hypothetical protein n=3 Tax=Klebsiella pneumoniae TaxID=573 RepID=UPI0025A08DDD
MQGTSTPSLHQYRIAPDTRHPDINLIKAHLDEGFQQAKSEGLKVEISDYKERLYLYIREGANKILIRDHHIHPERIPEGHHETTT